MAQAKNHFTNATGLRPEAIGEPGQRTFRLLVDSGSSSAVIWLEKEQLFHLALAIQQLIVTLPEEDQDSGTAPHDQEAPGLTRLEFKADKLVLGHDARSGLFIVDAHDMEDEDEETATVRVWVGREHVKGLSQEALRVCAAGRPLCPLCGRPLDDGGHACPRVNGHVTPADL